MLKLALWDFGFSDVWGGYVGHLGGLVTSLRLQLDSRVRLVERLASSRSGVLRPAKHDEEQRQTIGGSKYGVKSVEPFPTNIIKSIGYAQLKRNIMYSPYGATKQNRNRNMNRKMRNMSTLCTCPSSTLSSRSLLSPPPLGEGCSPPLGRTPWWGSLWWWQWPWGVVCW